MEYIPKLAERTRAKMKMNLSGGAGTGKTYSSLLIAFGLVGKWEDIYVIDAENSAHLYAHLPDDYGYKGQRYNIVTMDIDNCAPEEYIKAIDVCISVGAKAIIIDGISQEWKSVLDFVDANGGGMAWNKATPRHNEFVKKIIGADVHIITTCRRIVETIVVQNDKGKNVPMEVGMKDVMRDGYAHEVTIYGYMDEKYMFTVKKDRTQVFTKKEEGAIPFMPTIETGKKIKKWCDDGKDMEAEMTDALGAISHCDNAIELSVVCDSYDFLMTEKQFLDAIRLRALGCLENYNNGNEIFQNWSALPMLQGDVELKRAVKLRCIEMVHLFTTLDSLKSFWEAVCGTKDSPTSMKFLREDADFVAAVNAEKELIRNKPASDPFDDVVSVPAPKKEMVGAGTKEEPLKRVYRKTGKAASDAGKTASDKK
jgi:hypothetical protein